jgi:hypothetical protein
LITAHQAVCFDLDSTLRDSRQRHHSSPVQDPTKTWNDYFQLGHLDTPMPGPIALMKILYPHYQVHIVSGSGEIARGQTLDWLRKNAGSGWDFVALRAEDDHTENGVYKAAYVQKLQKRGIEVVLFFEDWGPAARSIHVLTGVPPVVVNPLYPCTSCGFDVMAQEPAAHTPSNVAGLAMDAGSTPV